MKMSITWLACLTTLVIPTVGCASGLATYPLAPHGAPVRLEGDVAAGYATYHAQLDPFGRWAPDSLHGVHWCPATVGFQPYRSGGHWGAAPASGAYGAAAGATVWQDTSGTAWEDVTLHHGWWTRPDEEADGSWCWVPGAEVTPARVVWCEGAGFVGWAPEPVDGDYAEGDEDALAWTFELMGTLLEDALDRQVLTGEAASEANAQTVGAGVRAGHAGPSSVEVGRARQVLVTYVQGQKALQALATTAGSSAAGSKPSSGASGSSTGSSTPSTSSTSSKSSTASSDDPGVSVSLRAVAMDDELPPGMLMYASLPRDPADTAGGSALPHVAVPGGEASRATIARNAETASAARYGAYGAGGAGVALHPASSYAYDPSSHGSSRSSSSSHGSHSSSRLSSSSSSSHSSSSHSGHR